MRVAPGPGHFKDTPGIHLEASKWEPLEDTLPWEVRLPWPRGRVAGGRGSRAGIWGLPRGVFSCRAFAGVLEKTGTRPPLSARVRLASCQPFRGQTEARAAVATVAPSLGATPAHPSGRGVCSASRWGCMWPHGRV